MSEFTLKKINVLGQIIAAAKFKAPENISQNLLFLVSQQDRLVNFNCSLQMAKFYQCPYILHQSAGHDLPLDDPQWLALKIREWIEKSR